MMWRGQLWLNTVRMSVILSYDWMQVSWLQKLKNRQGSNRNKAPLQHKWEWMFLLGQVMETSHTLIKWQTAGPRKDGHDRTYYKPGISHFATKHKHPGQKIYHHHQQQHQGSDHNMKEDESFACSRSWKPLIHTPNEGMKAGPLSKDMSNVTVLFPCLSQGNALKLTLKVPSLWQMAFQDHPLWYPLLGTFLFSVPYCCPSCANYKVTSVLSMYVAHASKKCDTTFKTTYHCNYNNHHFIVRIPNIIMQSMDFLSHIVTQMYEYFTCKTSNVCKSNSQS